MEIKKKKVVSFFKKTIKIANQATDLLVNINLKHPTVANVSAVGLRLANSVLDHFEVDSGLDYSQYASLNFHHYRGFVKSLLIPKYVKTIKDRIAVYDIDGKELILTDNVFYHQKSINSKEILNAIAAMVPTNKKHFLLTAEYDDWWRNNEIIVSEDEIKNIFNTEKSRELNEHIQKFLDKGYNRSVIFLGKPGTGKTSIIRYIIDTSNKRSLRLTEKVLICLSEGSVRMILDLIQPHIVVIDDIDRIGSLNLSVLEEIAKRTPIFIASVNSMDNFVDNAYTRPGRFDEIITIDRLDDEVIDSIIGPGLCEEIRNRLVNLPIAYLNEFKKYREVLGLERAIANIDNLVLRNETVKKKE